jgi:hypothetical protein
MTRDEIDKFLLERLSRIESVVLGVADRIRELRELTDCCEHERLIELYRAVGAVWLENEALRWSAAVVRAGVQGDIARRRNSRRHNDDQDGERDAEYAAVRRASAERAEKRKEKCSVCGWPTGSAECKSHHDQEAAE